MDFDKLSILEKIYPIRTEKIHSYGTAGFRENADGLDRVFFIVGILAGLRSKKLDGRSIGIMITASHNPAQDNGVKLIDPLGEMLTSSWEVYATKLSNSAELLKTIQEIIESEKIDLRVRSNVIFGHDTRESCKRLIKSLKDGFSCFGDSDRSLRFVESGLKTTPQLHYLVRCLNDGGRYGSPTEEGYYEKLSTAFKQINEGTSKKSTLTIDCANGVGAPKLELLKPYLSGSFLDLRLISTETGEPKSLNNGCGADHVKSNQRPPEKFELKRLDRACSFDGDSDRVVYYYLDESDRFRLMDGDKISTLVAGYIKELIELESDDELKKSTKIGVVQTAYANGNSTRYIEEKLGLPVTCTPTGVKHLHHASQEYDIGIYFEANGHGTITFSDEVLKKLPKASKLLRLSDLINQTVGDSISDMLVVETILNQRGWSMKDWDDEYEELPNRLVKVLVKDRKRFLTEDAERRLVEPLGMQENLNGIVKNFKNGRSFVRPSGTEDCVRVYAEADTRELTDELAFRVAGMVFDFSGKGERPKEFL